MNIILYSTHCPRCCVLEKKLKEKNIQYTENNSIDEMLSLGINEVPVLMVDSQFLKFKEAVNWINEQEVNIQCI